MTTIGILHLDPRPGEIERNLEAIEAASARAAAAGADLVMAPELAVSGYGFCDVIGADWIQRGQRDLQERLGSLSKKLGIHLLVGAPEHDPATGRLHNSALVLDRDGAVIAAHRKINCLRVGAEAWSTRGDVVTVVDLPGIGPAGLFVCADMYSPRAIAETRDRGAGLFLSLANWAPGENGPEGIWERASLSAPVVVCNRTGTDVIDFQGAHSLAAAGGNRIAEFSAAQPAILLVDWNPSARSLQDWRIL